MKIKFGRTTLAAIAFGLIGATLSNPASATRSQMANAASPQMTNKVIEGLTQKGIEQRFIPALVEGLVGGDTAAALTDEIVRQSNDTYYEAVAKKFDLVQTNISRPLKCDSFHLVRRAAFLHEMHFPEAPGKSPAGEWYHDIWAFEGCGVTHFLHLSVIKADTPRPFHPPVVILVGQTTATALLIIDISRKLLPLAVVQLTNGNQTACPGERPMVVSVTPQGDVESGGEINEEWVVAFCRKLGTYAVHFTPTPADGGTDFGAKLKHQDTY